MSDPVNPESPPLILPGKGMIPDPAYTIPTKRLAGSEGCLNCGTALEGPFCHYCGQPDRNFLRFFPVLFRELMTDFLDLDSRFARTLKPLLFRPGKLTRDYLEGRRFRYTPPLRLYLFSSIAFFLIAAFVSSELTPDDLEASSGSGIKITTGTDEEMRQVEEALKILPPSLRDQVDLASADEAQRDKDFFDDGEIQFNGEPWDRETNPVDVQWFPQWLNDRINDEIGDSPRKADLINANPNLIKDQVFDLLPATVFIMLPVVALMFKFWYLFSGRYYVEHLILALHNHSFLFVILTLLLPLDLLEIWLNSHDQLFAEKIVFWVTVAAMIWIPLYLLKSLRTVYQQNWFLTLGKALVIGISYLVLITLVSVSVAILSFILI